MKLFDTIRAGSIVTIVTPHGSKIKGRAVMKFFDIWLFNAGGRHGAPKIASKLNVIKVNNKA